MTEQNSVATHGVKTVDEILMARPSADGDGVKLLRVFGGGGDPARFDPFLMMDEFGSYEASDYIGGFPPHPHRGFETITYMLEGRMEHQDQMGNVGNLQNGDVQWMVAGSGVIHSEMPKQTEGRMRGFQVWLNLPARTKMQSPSYQDIGAAAIPEIAMAGVTGKAIAGKIAINGENVEGVVTRPDTDPIYLDLHFSDDSQTYALTVPQGYTTLLYVYEGKVQVGEAETTVERGHMARLGREGDTIQIRPQTEDTRVVLLAGAALGEPIVQYGPFVMNTREEIDQALQDYRDGTFAKSG